MDTSNNKKDHKKKIIIALITLLIVILAVGSYALWQETKKQTNKNAIITACLDITYTNESNDINIDGMWPTTDAASASLTPYTFSITNNCDNPIYYEVAMESVESNSGMAYIGDNYIKLSLDTSVPLVYNDLTTIEDDVNTSYTIRSTKKINEKYIGPHATNTHTIRMWLDEDTPFSEMNKTFKSKIKILSSQQTAIAKTPEYTDEDCFTVDSNGVLTAYDTTNCPMNGATIVIPPTVNGTTITELGTQIFGTSGTSTSGKKVAYIDISNMTGLRVINKCPFGKSSATACASNYNPDAATTYPLVIPYGVTTIGDFAFGFYRGNNTELIIPDTVTTIGRNAFAQFRGDSIKLSSNLESIGQQAFNYWKGLAGDNSSSTIKSPLIIPDSVTNIDQKAFFNYRGSYLKLSNSLTTLKTQAFWRYIGTGAELEIPASLTTIGDSAFSAFKGDNIIFNDGLVTIEGGAFERYNDGPLNLPNTLVTIGDEAFSSFDYGNVTLPATVNKLGTLVFNNISYDKTITILNPNPESMTLGTQPFGNAELVCVSGACPNWSW